MPQPCSVRSLLHALLLAACCGLWTESPSAQIKGVTIAYSVEPTVIAMHEPVIVRFDVLNESTQPITLQLGVDRKESFSLALRRPDGSEQKRPPLPRREGAFRVGKVNLGPGERLRHQLLLSEWASLSTPGAYELDVRLLTPIEMSSGAQFMSERYRTRFEVMPRDEAHLKAACERFVQQIESTDNVEEMQGAAAALAHVDDPIVVPYLEQALGTGKYVEHQAIEGLARIGNEDAVRILMAVVKESPAWPPSAETLAGTRAILAWQALHRIAATTSNERLRQEIQRTTP